MTGSLKSKDSVLSVLVLAYLLDQDSCVCSARSVTSVITNTSFKVPAFKTSGACTLGGTLLATFITLGTTTVCVDEVLFLAIEAWRLVEDIANIAVLVIAWVAETIVKRIAFIATHAS